MGTAAHSYRFANLQHTLVIRDDGVQVVWNPLSKRPQIAAGSAYLQWVAEGRPEPEAYRP
jgi:hypothetical protein